MTTGLVVILTTGTAAPTAAFSDAASAPLPGLGAKIQVNAWHCNVYADKCSFRTSTKALRGSERYQVSRITNVATVKANGWQATLSVSPSATYVSEDTRRIRWSNTNSWISDISGIADPGGSMNTSITTCSDGSAFRSGVKAFASACANG
ncbi:hypothetical protein [Streptomyces sp. NPDC060194]|uniref:hypothetical protein n=1 Tax=Streptomyces sp. NPDC060194 TaxID=3347069 RepID=UPI0036614CA8